MKNTIYLLLALIPALGGCATHYGLAAPLANLARIGLINDPRQVNRLEKAMTDGDIANLLDANVRAKLPTGVAVARIKSRCSGYQPHLATIDAEELEGWEKAIGNQAHISGVCPISSLSMGGTSVTLHSLRTAAARMDCELLLVYLQADASVDNFNDAAVLYWTVVGLWLVPGNVIEHKTVMQGILVDCRTGAILGTATGDNHQKRLCPAAFADIRKTELSSRTPAEALADLQKGAGRLLKRVVETAVAGSRLGRKAHLFPEHLGAREKVGLRSKSPQPSTHGEIFCAPPRGADMGLWFETECKAKDSRKGELP